MLNFFNSNFICIFDMRGGETSYKYFICCMAKGKAMKGLKIAQFKNLTIEDFVNHHVEYELVHGMRLSRKAILHHKYIYLNDVIIRRCLQRKEEDGIYFKANYNLMLAVLGKDYITMLRNLIDMGVLRMIDSSYIKSEKSRDIELVDRNITYPCICNNLKVIAYHKKYAELRKKDKQQRNSQLEKESNNVDAEHKAMLERYGEIIKQIRLTRKEEGLRFINSLTDLSPWSYYRYLCSLENFDANELREPIIDCNGRIYHFLTNLPKSLKPFFNIKFQVDISNSHPLLINHFIMNHYINDSNKDVFHNILSSFFSNIFISNISIHNVCKQLRKELKDNKIDIPKDVVSYIVETSLGKFWDSLQQKHHIADRGRMKAETFRQVFYSNITTIYNKDKEGKEMDYEILKCFRKQYPNVWRVIRSLKRQCGKEKGCNLACKMMQLEAKLMCNALKQCYERGCSVLNIHDALIVLDVAENEHVQAEEVEAVLKDSFHAMGLFPSVSIELYNAEVVAQAA